ncbi:MAG: coiled-coil domain-containing protein [Planctomycetota bacterium]|jgi:hypothetical protein
MTRNRPNIIPNDPTHPRARARGFFARPRRRPGVCHGQARLVRAGLGKRTFYGAIQLTTVLCLLVILTACQSGPRNFENENDRLREEVADLKTRVEQLETENRGLKTQLAVAEQQDGADANPLPDGLVSPACVKLKITGLSGGVDTNQDGVDDTLRVYLQTLDPRDRFVQTLGAVDATVVAITPGEPAQTLATIRIDPIAFDKAYRSGFTSTHYTLTLRLDSPPPKTATELTVRLKLTDLQTGAELEAESVLPFVAAIPE